MSNAQLFSGIGIKQDLCYFFTKRYDTLWFAQMYFLENKIQVLFTQCLELIAKYINFKLGKDILNC